MSRTATTGKDAAFFKATANKSKKINMAPKVMKPGTRL